MIEAVLVTFAIGGNKSFITIDIYYYYPMAGPILVPACCNP